MSYTLLLLLGAVASSQAFLDSLISPTNHTCPGNQFACQNGKCIPENKRCDSSNDCQDFSDEENCEVYHCLEPRYFKCANGRCISKAFVCDDENDCEDFSDEKNCENFQLTLQKNHTCSPGEWQCQDKLCILNEWVCNGEADCLDGTDETIGCSAKIECDGFKCNNGHCVPTEWRCDGHNDCIDNSDEQDCEHHFDIKQCTADNDKFLCSDKRACLDMHQVCDGTKHCSDGSDEGKSCTSSCDKLNCQHRCQRLPTGPKCLCPKGFQTVNSRQCHDINECETYGICDQACHNTQGSYYCGCAEKYHLQDDKKTCKAIGGEPLMIFSSKTEIRGITLQSEIYFPVAKNLKQVVGVHYDGHHVYWTDIFSEHESIVRSLEDGSQRELLVTAGLGLPEDLALDYLTGNIYFTDAQRKHIGVCTNDGTHCTVLVNDFIRKPRAICLNVDDSEMYWTDWGTPSEIAVASMDGTNQRPFVDSDIHWPNGLALDRPNNRLYWTDARKATLESINLDGTDRRVILQDVVKHPYAIAVFENRLFWSDWATHSIQHCDKFTGKNHTTLVKENRQYIYGLDIFHSALKTRSANPCDLALCSDICLLSANTKGYSCACAENRQLSTDRHTCRTLQKPQNLILGAGNLLVTIQHKKLGKHDLEALPTNIKSIGAMAYNPINDTLYVSDLVLKKIVQVDMKTGDSKALDLDNVGRVTCMDYDHFGNNLYVCAEDKGAVEIISLSTMARTVVLHDLDGELPESIALVPEEGIMFVALKRPSTRESHIDRLFMDGTSRTHSIDSNLLGPVHLTFDYHLYRLFWTDTSTGDIESTSLEGDDRHTFRTLSTSPCGIAVLDNELFWVNQFSRRVYWAEVNGTSTDNKKVTLDMPDDLERVELVSTAPKRGGGLCKNNGNCSHLCLVSHKAQVCACPVGMRLKDDDRTCVKLEECQGGQFLCVKSNTCILSSYRCNGNKDCLDGEDELDCQKPKHCPLGFFQCTNGECISEDLVCNSEHDCRDKSDEADCAHHTQECPEEHFKCPNEQRQCLHNRYLCDGVQDCRDGSDEHNCQSLTCSSGQFRCLSGQCIPKSWECDSEYDCSDMSDEHLACPKAKCSGEMFQCSNGKCLDRELQCDQTDDCGDNSDESSCQYNLHGLCGVGEFACKSNKSICVVEQARCNGTSECPQHEDEADCDDCNVDEFGCRNGKCVPTQWICDKVDDCGDGSDEAQELCAHSTVAQYVNCTDGFRCHSGACIDKSLLCNGKPDCSDGSDENGQCETSCQHSPCSQTCIKTPIGAICSCNDGYKLADNGYTCLDIDECSKDPPPCSQLCYNEPGSYTCDCYNGFLLRTDKKSCKSEGDKMVLVYSADNQIRTLSQDNTLQVLFSDDTPRITGLDVDVARDFVYFSIQSAGTLHRISTKTQQREYMDHLGQPSKLSVDWSTGNVYFVNGESIMVCHFDTKSCGRFMPIEANTQVSALAVDATNRVLFYSVTSWYVFSSPSYILYKCNLDGTRKQELAATRQGYVTGLTYNLNSRTLYYADQHSNTIKSMTYEGKNEQTLFRNVSRPISLKYFEDHLYFSGHGGFMSKCLLFGQRRCDTFKLHTYSSDFFAFDQQTLQPMSKNVCLDNKCGLLCLTGNDDYECLCEDGGIRKDCGTQSVESGDRHVHTVQMVEGKTKSASGVVLTGILVPICLLLVGVLMYVVVKRRNSGNFNISMRFYNPTYGRQTDAVDSKSILKPGQHEYSNPTYEDGA